MPKCSELADNLTKIAMNLAAREEVRNFDDVVMAMKEFFPLINRQYLVDAFVEKAEANKKKVDALTKKLQAIAREPLADNNLKKSVAEFVKLMEEGEPPEKAPAKKKPSLAIQELRNTRDNVKKWLETGDPAMREKIANQITEVTDKIARGEVETTHRTGKLHDEIQEMQNELDALKTKMRADKEQKGLVDKIEMLQKHLEEGTLPEAQKKVIQGSDATQMLRSILYDLRKKLNASPAAQKQRLEKSLASLEQMLRSGDILPKPHVDPVHTKEISELMFRRDLVKQEIQDELRNLQPMTWPGRVAKSWDLVRLMMTTGEFSFMLRQGGVYALTHPIKWSGAMVNSFKSFASAKGLYDVNQAIYTRKNAPLYKQADMKLLHEGMSLTRTEEVIMNYWMDRLPIMRNFNRAAIGFFNTMRADAFDAGYETLSRTGEMTGEEMKIWANYINVMSGRGKLGIGNMSLEAAALPLNRLFFSARYVSSRFQLLTGQPLWTMTGKGSARIRMHIAKEYVRLAMGLLTIYSLAMLTGADVEEDPRSSDFGKLRFGNRRLDVLMGMSQVAAFMSRLITGKYKTQAGELLALRGPEKTYGGPDIMSVMGRFMRSKLSPQFGVAMNMLTGETYLGEEVSLLNSIPQLGYPITYGDIYEVMKEDNMPLNVSLSVLTFLGMGLQTYQPREKSRTGDAKLSRKEIQKLLEKK